MSNLVELVARGLWDREGKPWQSRLNNHALVEGYACELRRPYLPSQAVEAEVGQR